MPRTKVLAVRTAAVGVAGMAALAGRYARGTARADRSWPGQVEARLRDLGEVDKVSILPLVERLTPSGGGLHGEPGVSYLVSAGGRRVLFDSGLSGGRPESALAHNARLLGVRLALEPPGVPAYVPTLMRHPRADIAVTTGPRVIAPAMAVLPPLPRMLFWAGYITEQALVVNVRGFGLVLISGCGHPRIEQMLGITERVLDVPIRAVVGGLHLPVHAAGTPLMPQAVIGNPHPPWRPIGERDAKHVMDDVEARGLRLIALSGHDSTPWTFDAFTRRFGDRYRTLRAGEELQITAANAGIVVHQSAPTVGTLARKLRKPGCESQ